MVRAKEMRNETVRAKGALATDIGMTVSGLVMAATPLILWMSPTKASFYITLTVCLTAFGVLVLLSKFGPEDEAAAPAKENNSSKITLSPELIAHLQGQRELSRKELPELKKFVRDKSQKPKARPDDE